MLSSVGHSQSSPLTQPKASLSEITTYAQGLLAKVQQGSIDEIQEFSAYLIDQTRNLLFALHKEERADDLYGIIPLLFDALNHPQISHQDFHKYIVAKTLRCCIEAVFLVAHQQHNLISESNRQDVLLKLEALSLQATKENKPGQTGFFFEIDYCRELLKAFESPASLVDIKAVLDAIKEVATDHKIGLALDLIKQLWAKKIKDWFVPALTLSWMGAVVLKNPSIFPLLQEEISKAFEKQVTFINKSGEKNIRLVVTDILYEIVCFGPPDVQAKALFGGPNSIGLKDIISQSPKEVRCRALELISRLRSHPSPSISSQAHQIYENSPQKTDPKILKIFKESLPGLTIPTKVPTKELLDKRLEDSKDRALASIDLKLTDIQTVVNTVLSTEPDLKESDHPIHQELLKGARTCDEIKILSSLKDGAHIDAKDDAGNNALHLLILNAENAQNNLEDLIKILIDKKIDLEAKNKEGKTAFQLAQEQGLQWPVFHLLIEASTATAKKSLLNQTFFDYGLRSFSTSNLPAFVRYVVKYLISINASLTTFQKYYMLLPSKAALEHIRRVFLNTLQNGQLTEISQKLSEIPNRFGLRQSYLIDQEKFMEMVSRITTKIPNDYEITIPSLGTLYLKPEVAKEILADDGHIQKHYKQGLHRVAAAKSKEYNLHFKEAPIHPLMEYGVGNFLSRLAGKSTPCTVLARLEIKGKKLAYPLLISETIEGEPFTETSSANLDKKHLSRQLFARILYRPGDESLPNLIKAQARVYCVDNDIAFVEPIEQKLVSDTINFISALFCLDDFEIDSEEIDLFLTLAGDLITHDWLQDLEKKEKEYTELFTKEEQELFYKTFDFTPTILFRKGTIANLCLQFTHLKKFLEEKRKKNEPVKASELLSTLITIHDEAPSAIGPKVERAYNKGRSLPTLQERLTKASGDQGKSRTAVEARRVSLNAVPTSEEIQKREKFSIQKAWLEIISLMNIESYATMQDKKLFVDFSKITTDGKTDNEHHTLILTAVLLFLTKRNIKPPKIILWNCAALDKKTLAELLHKDLVHLDLRNSPTLTNEDILTIATTCPALQELYLTGCEKITIIENRTTENQELSFPELKVLHAASCSLKTLRLNIPKIEELRIEKNSNLNNDSTSISPPWNGDTVPKYSSDFALSQSLMYRKSTIYYPYQETIVTKDKKFIYGLRESLGELQKCEIYSLDHRERKNGLYWTNDKYHACLENEEFIREDNNQFQVFSFTNETGKLSACSPIFLHPETKKIKVIRLEDNKFASWSVDETSKESTISIWGGKFDSFDTTIEKSLLVLKGHTDRIVCLKQLSDKTLASSSLDSTTKIWNVETGDCLQTLTGIGFGLLQFNNNYLLGLSFSERTSSSLDAVIIWNLQTGGVEKLKVGPMRNSEEAICELEKGEIAVNLRDGNIKIVNVKTAICVRTLSGHYRAVNCSLQLNNKRLASASYDRSIKIWDLDSGKSILTLDAGSSIYKLLQPRNNQLLSVQENHDMLIAIRYYTKLWTLPH